MGSGTQNDKSPDTGSLYAWLCRDEDGVEGIVAAPISDGVFPLVMTDLDRALRFRSFAEVAAALRGFPAALVRFERREEIARTEGNAA